MGRSKIDAKNNYAPHVTRNFNQTDIIILAAGGETHSWSLHMIPNSLFLAVLLGQYASHFLDQCIPMTIQVEFVVPQPSGVYSTILLKVLANMQCMCFHYQSLCGNPPCLLHQ